MVVRCTPTAWAISATVCSLLPGDDRDTRETGHGLILAAA